MSHIALYRAWRPQTFQDMVGQQHIVQTLQNAIREQRVSHAYLFSGPRGTGKTTAAKVLAKAVNCTQGPAGSFVEPCNHCAACEGITSGTIMDVVEIDAASNRGIDEIREIRDKVRYAPSEVRMKVYIIDEVHMLTTEAFNALLKTLEEPPGHVIFILATTEPHRLPATIVSRCQRFDFRQVSLEEQTARLLHICTTEGIQAEPSAIAYIARLSEGGMRDAISLLEQTAAFAGGNITLDMAVDVTGGIAAEQFYQLAQAIQERNAAVVLTLVEGLMQAGKSADKCMENLVYYFRDLLVIKLSTIHQTATTSSEPSNTVIKSTTTVTDRIVDVEQFQQMANAFSNAQLFTMIDVLNAYQLELKYATSPQTMFEVAMLKLCTLDQTEASNYDGDSKRTSATGSHSHNNAEVGTAEITILRKQLAALEDKVKQLEQANAGTNSLATGVGASNKKSTIANNVRGGFGAGVASIRTKVKLDPYVAVHNQTETVDARMKWNDLLQRVRDEKVTLHAWLKDGELAAVAEGDLVVAFKNDIHRETTEKPDHRVIIERVAEQVLKKPFRLVTVMQREWQAALEAGNHAPVDEVFELEPEPLSKETIKELSPQQPEWVSEAVKLFGEDLVVIKDDE
ncbi:DNA polymerase III subunit gamma/tau [Paenibacillus yanchengensis]|uniref:DNA-directed DNA polymerase n=1 Tax=Paenibacillus yanchengensis TaxID=2035833 RepID=A0ABW4YPM2_9BACL